MVGEFLFAPEERGEGPKMSVDRKLAWVGLAVGIAGLIPIFKEAGSAWALAVLLLLLAVGGYLIYSEWSNTRTAVSILSVEKKAEIFDAAGKRALLKRTQKIRVNQGWLHDYWFRNLVGDGQFGQFTIDGEPPSQTAKLGCLVSLAKHFDHPLSKGTVRDLRLECEAYDCFPDKEEGLLHDVAQDTRLLVLKVELPANRTCKESHLLLEAAGEPTKELGAPEISSDRRTITATVKRPRTGFSYHLQWTW
jgi:hypothetical protein